MFKKRTSIVVSSIVILILCSVQGTLAADAPLPELKVESVTTTMYDELFITTALAGMRHSSRQEGIVFLAVHAVLLPQWTEDINRLRIKAEDILLIAADGTAFPMIGYFKYIGQIELSTNALSVYRDNDWQEEPQKVYYNAMFAVPAATQNYQLQLGPLTIAVEKPANAEQWPDHSSTLQVEILSSRIVDEVKSIHKVGTEQLETTVSNPHGGLLEVTVKITPLTPPIGNYDAYSNFFWHAPWFWVFCDTGYYTQAVGEHDDGTLKDAVMYTHHYSNDAWSFIEATLYFAVPKDIASFTLIYVTSPVAERVLE